MLKRKFYSGEQVTRIVLEAANRADALARFAKEPSADVEPVVRCSECRNCSVDYCDIMGKFVPPDWFCKEGKRRDG